MEHVCSPHGDKARPRELNLAARVKDKGQWRESTAWQSLELTLSQRLEPKWLRGILTNQGKEALREPITDFEPTGEVPCPQYAQDFARKKRDDQRLILERLSKCKRALAGDTHAPIFLG